MFGETKRNWMQAFCELLVLCIKNETSYHIKYKIVGETIVIKFKCRHIFQNVFHAQHSRCIQMIEMDTFRDASVFVRCVVQYQFIDC